MKLQPITDPERRKEVSDAWKERRYTPAYMKWLYARRKINVDKLAIFREAFSIAMAAEALEEAKAALRQAILDEERLDHEVGNRFDHEQQHGYYEE